MSKQVPTGARGGTTPEADLPDPAVGDDRIRHHLDEVLRDPLFANSKRITSFLSFVVAQALNEVPESQVKERTIGIELFGRAPSYDTNNDPIVRIAAGEVRKKLAQYYYSHPDSDLQIQIPVGSYLPRFRVPASRPPVQLYEETTATPLKVEEISLPAKSSEMPLPLPVADLQASAEPERAAVSKRQVPAKFVVAGLGILVALAAGFWAFWNRADSVDRFWSSFSDPTRNVLIVSGSVTPTPDALSQYHYEASSIALQDVEVTSRLRSELALRHVKTSLMLSATASLTDLRNGPVVLIGAFNNDWTQRLSKSLPFTFERSPDRRFGSIVDRSDPTRSWTIDFGVPNAHLSEDYGIVARFNDSVTEQNVVIIAGISAEGTLAGGEALTTPKYLDEVLRDVGKNAQRFEVVFKTETIDGESGPPKIVATKTW